MKSRIAVVLLLLLVAVPSFAASPTWLETQVKSGYNFFFDVASGTWRAPAVNSDGYILTTSSGGTATPTYVTPVSDKRGSIRSFAPFSTTLATSSVTLLSSLASFTPPCIVRLQGRGVWYFLENATSTVSSVASGTRLAAYDVFTLSPELGTLDITMVASSDAPVFIHGSIDTTAP